MSFVKPSSRLTPNSRRWSATAVAEGVVSEVVEVVVVVVVEGEDTVAAATVVATLLPWATVVGDSGEANRQEDHGIIREMVRQKRA